ncbi:uncharacterized protein LOC100376867 [Saccoglossus kowalevskii]|uniref:Uncharacterized protein LOC100376867 n=1 Tax=Saccoglossus kowalevskii TaxID=10224 RepID=A0ABM0GN45_SACKO|nr:PREDICTED: uncharacterized protein LOC100376867 [Saccoglossus kowalevskii]
MKTGVFILALVAGTALAAPKLLHAKPKGQPETRIPRFNVVMFHSMNKDCSFDVTFERADRTYTPKLNLQYRFYDSLGNTLYRGDIAIEKRVISETLKLTPLPGFKAPYFVAGKVYVDNDSENDGVIRTHEMDDGQCLKKKKRKEEKRSNA